MYLKKRGNNYYKYKSVRVGSDIKTKYLGIATDEEIKEHKKNKSTWRRLFK